MESSPKDIALQIARRLTTLRLQHAWTRDELARRARVNVHTLKRFETTGQISLSRLIGICEALGILDDFIRAFKPRHRINIKDWQIQEGKQRLRGRSHKPEDEV